MKQLIVIICMLLVFASGYASESVELNQWRVRSAGEEEYSKKRCERNKKWYWCGLLPNAYKHHEIYDSAGKFVFYMHFNVKSLPENATPILVINNIAPDSVIIFANKKLKLIKQKKKSDNPFDTEYWYEIPAEDFRLTQSSIANRMVIWTPQIRKEKIPLNRIKSRIVFGNPDKIAEREKRRKLQYPYLYDASDLDDPYVARHW